MSKVHRNLLASATMVVKTSAIMVVQNRVINRLRWTFDIFYIDARSLHNKITVLVLKAKVVSISDEKQNISFCVFVSRISPPNSKFFTFLATKPWKTVGSLNRLQWIFDIFYFDARSLPNKIKVLVLKVKVVSVSDEKESCSFCVLVVDIFPPNSKSSHFWQKAWKTVLS